VSWLGYTNCQRMTSPPRDIARSQDVHGGRKREQSSKSERERAPIEKGCNEYTVLLRDADLCLPGTLNTAYIS